MCRPAFARAVVIMDQETYGEGNFRIDRRGYDTDDPAAREERVDVSPAGTEGIFVDLEPPVCDDLK